MWQQHEAANTDAANDNNNDGDEPIQKPIEHDDGGDNNSDGDEDTNESGSRWDGTWKQLSSTIATTPNCFNMSLDHKCKIGQ